MKVTIYIRKENEEQWAEIVNKSDWVNEQLTGNESDLERRIRRIVTEVYNEMRYQ